VEEGEYSALGGYRRSLPPSGPGDRQMGQFLRPVTLWPSHRPPLGHLYWRHRNFKIKNIYEGLIQIDPQGADFYRENLEAFLGELDALDRYISESFEGFANRYFLVFHPALGYFARDYNLNQLAIERELITFLYTLFPA
jgi:hypothetical protein